MADLNSLSELTRQLAYYQSGGKDPGQSDLEKVNNIFGTVNTGVSNYQDIIKKVLEAKKTQIETERLKTEVESGRRSLTPIEITAGKSPIAGMTAGTEMPSGIAGIEGQPIMQAPMKSNLSPALSPFGNFTPEETQKLAGAESSLARSSKQVEKLYINPVLRQISLTPQEGYFEVSPNTAATIAAGPAKEESSATRQAETFKRTQDESLLTPDEAIKLNVPYGTKRKQAEGLTPQRPPTEGQGTTAVYANRMEQANEILGKLENYAQTANPLAFQTQAKLPDVANKLKSAEFQSIEQAKRNFLNSVLRRESGAVISPTEFQEGNRQYFPLPGDTDATLAQKRQNRETAIRGFVNIAGPAYVPNPIQNQAPQSTPKFGEKRVKDGVTYERRPDGKWHPLNH